MIKTKEKDIIKDYEITLLNGEIAKIKDSKKFKALKSSEYNFYFNKSTGFFVRWGKGDYKNKPKSINKQEMDLYMTWTAIWKEKFDIREFVADLQTDGSTELGLPEILDIEVSTICSKGCSFCYKSNTMNGKYMSTEDFTKIIDKIGPSLTQVALGIGNIDQPNLFEIMDVCRSRGIVPNLTINGALMTKEIYDGLAERCGAIAVSYYDKDDCFNSVYELATVRGMKQINIHYFLSEETYEQGMQLIDDIENDPRMKDFNALVFLSAKLRGRAKKNDFHLLSQEKYDKIALKALYSEKISVGMDSCSAFKTLEAYKNEPNYDQIYQAVEPCESSIYSTYINVDGEYFPCSFSEGLDHGEKSGDWRKGLNVLECEDFVKDIWFSEKTRKFADEVNACRSCGKSCSIFEI